MPRDLQQIHAEATAETLEGMSDLYAQLKPFDAEERNSDASPDLRSDAEKITSVKLYPKALTLQDVDACCVLEDAAFPPEQRCTREKFIYRITVTPELCHGLFTTASEDYNSHHLQHAETARAACTVESFSSRKQILIGHAIGTLSTNETVLDDDMALPPHWDDPSKPKNPRLGHKPHGRVVMLHSLAVLPAYQGKCIGSTLLKGYIDLLRLSKNYDRLAIIADKSHIDYYTRRGFTNLGPSKAAFGGVEWFDLVLDFPHEGED